MSVALGGTVFAALGGATAGTLLSSPQAPAHPLSRLIGLQHMFVTSFHAALLVCAAFAALGIFTALARGNEARVKKAKKELVKNVCSAAGQRVSDEIGHFHLETLMVYFSQ